MDSIVKRTDDAMYRKLFGSKLSNLMFITFTTGPPFVHEKLKEVRTTWDGVFEAIDLYELDKKMRTVCGTWRKSLVDLINQRTEFEKQLKALKKKVHLLELKAIKAAQKPRKQIVHENHHQNSSCQSTTRKHRPNRCGKLALEQNPAPKRSKTDKDLSIAAEQNIGSNSPNWSSVLLTPPPECNETQSPTSIIDSAFTVTTANNSSFWTSLNSIGSQSSKFPSMLMAQNIELPFLSDLSQQSTTKSTNVIELNTECISDVTAPALAAATATTTTPNVPIHTENVPIQSNQAHTMELDLNLEMTVESSINFEIDTETLTAINAMDAHAQPLQYKSSEVDTINNGSDVSRRTTTPSPPILSIDGTIEYQSINSTKSQQIKINLLNPSAIEQVREHELATATKTTAAAAAVKPAQVKRIQPSEWKTPAISYDRKDSIKNVSFRAQPIRREGFERSGMCSIM